MSALSASPSTGKLYRWAHAHEWLDEQLAKANVGDLRDFATAMARVLDADTIQDLFQDDMNADGYFDPVEGS